MKSNMTKKIVGALNSFRFSFCFNMRQKTQFPDAKFICIHNAPIHQLNWKGHKANPLAPVPLPLPLPCLPAPFVPASCCTTNGWRACKLRRVANESSRASALSSECVSVIRVFNVPHTHTYTQLNCVLHCAACHLICLASAPQRHLALTLISPNFRHCHMCSSVPALPLSLCPAVPQLSLFLLTAFSPCLLVANFA